MSLSDKVFGKFTSMDFLTDDDGMSVMCFLIVGGRVT